MMRASLLLGLELSLTDYGAEGGAEGPHGLTRAHIKVSEHAGDLHPRYLPTDLSIDLPMEPSVYLSIRLPRPNYLSTYLLTYLPTYLPTHLPTYLPTYLSIYLST